jgi:hypothetical protein
MQPEITYVTEVRPGWVKTCPYCGREIRFTKLVNTELVPFFYSDASNDVLIRDKDRELVRAATAAGEEDVRELQELWLEILDTAPLPPNGGRFSLWANIRCPFCRIEFPYNNGIRDVRVRLYEPNVVLVDGAVVVRDTASTSWRVAVTVQR